jgi:hypothetical protein
MCQVVGLDSAGNLVRANVNAVPITNSLTGGSNALVSNVGGNVSTLTPSAGTISQTLGFNSSGALVVAGIVPTTNLLTSGNNCIVSNVNGIISNLTPVAGQIDQIIGFNTTGSLVMGNSSTALQKAGATQFGVVKFDTSTSDLVETSSSSGIAVVGTNKITYPKMQQVVGAKTILGSQTAATNVSEIGLSSGLDMISNNLIVNFQNVPVTTSTTATTGNTVYLVNTSSGPISLTLPAASTVSKQFIVVKDNSGTANLNSITILGNIDGNLTQTVLTSSYSSLLLYSDGTKYTISSDYNSASSVLGSPARGSWNNYVTSGIPGGGINQQNAGSYSTPLTSGFMPFSILRQNSPAAANMNVGTNTITITRAGLYNVVFNGFGSATGSGVNNPFVQIQWTSGAITTVAGYAVWAGNSNGFPNINCSINLLVGDVLRCAFGCDGPTSFGWFGISYSVLQVPNSY